jgi:hypothetical protein
MQKFKAKPDQIPVTCQCECKGPPVSTLEDSDNFVDDSDIETYLTILKRAWSANFKMVWYALLRPLRTKLDGQDLASSSLQQLVVATTRTR